MAYVEWIYGKTGTGKTKMVEDLLIDKLNRGEIVVDEIAFMEPVIKEHGYTLADLSSNTKILIIDDLWPDDYTIKELLNLINGTTLKVKMKGFVRIHPEEIYITSLWKPEDLYTNDAFAASGRRPNADKLYEKISDIIHLE